MKVDDLTDPRVQALLQVHLANAKALTPPEFVQALDISGLKMPDVTFWTLWQDETLLGCGALKALDSLHGEVKSMHVYDAFRQQNLGGVILRYIIKAARDRGYKRLSLETGHPPHYVPAISLYKSFGFSQCPPFADYRDETFSRYMTLSLS